MPHDMVHKVFLSREAFLANVAAVGCLASVLAHVIHHMFFACERLGAELASGTNGGLVLFQPTMLSRDVIGIGKGNKKQCIEKIIKLLLKNRKFS